MQKVLRTLFVFLMQLAFVNNAVASELDTSLQKFKKVYEPRFDSLTECSEGSLYRLCDSSLRNEGNAPYILHHDGKTDKAIVLFHGLSDSPYYMRPIANYLYDLGHNVIVALLPGHGLKEAHEVMLDSKLSEYWIAHVQDVMALAPEFGNTILIGGFSTGGALAAQYTLNYPHNVDGLMLFSGAFALSGNAESLSKIWGIQWFARVLEGHYESEGPNPFKYPSVPSSAGLELMEVITDVRQKIDGGSVVKQPVYVVHSEDDMTTPVEGVAQFLEASSGQNTVFYINESHKVCHADVVLNTLFASRIDIDEEEVNPLETCAVPAANPVFRQMTNLMRIYLQGV